MRRRTVYAGLAILGLVILVFMDWSTALVYALFVALVAFAEWLWRWFESRRWSEREQDAQRLAAEERNQARARGPELEGINLPDGRIRGRPADRSGH